MGGVIARLLFERGYTLSAVAKTEKASEGSSDSSFKYVNKPIFKTTNAKKLK